MFYPEDSGYFISKNVPYMSRSNCNEFNTTVVYELELCTTSGSICQINGVNYTRHYGSVLLSQPGDLKSHAANVEPFECYAIHFSCDDREFIEKYLNRLPVQIFIKNYTEYEKTFQNLIMLLMDIRSKPNPVDLLEAKKDWFHYKFSDLLIGLYLESLAPISSNTSAYAKNIVNAQNFITNHFNEEITMKDIANAASLSESFTYVQFKKITGQTPHEYLTELRMQYARSQLILTKEPISEISLKAGFKKTNYLNQIFKRIEGTSPLQYRKNNEMSKLKW